MPPTKTKKSTTTKRRRQAAYIDEPGRKTRSPSAKRTTRTTRVAAGAKSAAKKPGIRSRTRAPARKRSSSSRVASSRI